MMDFMPHEKGAVEVHSRLKAWWLTNFNHYHLVQTRKIPERYLWNQHKDKKTWVLKKQR